MKSGKNSAANALHVDDYISQGINRQINLCK